MKTLINLLVVAMLTTAVSCGKRVDGVMSTTTADGQTVTVTAVNDRIVRVTNARQGEIPTATPGALLTPGQFTGAIADDGTVAVMTLPSGLRVTLVKATGEVRFDADSLCLLTDDGLRTHTDTTSVLSLSTPLCQRFYGAGERGHSLVLNGDTLDIYNTQNYGYTEGDPRTRRMGVCVPYVVSSQGYGVLFDDIAAARIVVDDTITYSSEAQEPISYYFVYGGDEATLASVTEAYVDLTGHQPLAPLWALGYITSKYGYHNEAEAIGTIDTLQSMGYPVDGIVLDLYWYGEEENMGALAWDNKKWPDPRKFLAELKSRGVKTVLITQPYVNKEGAAARYNELAQGDMFVVDSLGNVHDMSTWIAECSMLDVANPKTRQWLAEIYRDLTEQGVGGWWGDLGDLETHPRTVYHRGGGGKLLTARQYHNQYGNDWSGIISDVYAEHFPDTRLMSLMRGGTTGLQRYSVYPWSTDVSRSWGGLQPQIKIMLSSGLSGLGYMHHDVGGFAVDERCPRDPELYVRWMQLGLFSPVLRTHAQRIPEPYHYTEYADIILDLVRERYRWLPYNYTLAYQNAATGAPLVRPLNFADPCAPDNVGDQYMWGSELMVAPVMYQGADSRTIVVPQGVWVDYNNPSVAYQGPDTINYNAPLDVIPLLVKSGAIIPQASYAMANTGDYDTRRYDILYYPRASGESRFAIYEDDLKSTKSLADGRFALIVVDAQYADGVVKMTVNVEGRYPGIADKALTLRLPGIKASQVADLSVNGTPTAVAGNGEAVVNVKLTLDKPLDITFRVAND